MVVIQKGKRFQALNADVLPTTGISLHTVVEIVDTNVWKYWTGSSWNTIGTNTVNPISVIPGDVVGVGQSTGLNNSINPAAGGRTNSQSESVDIHLAGTGIGTSLAFVVIESTQPRPQGVYVGQKLFIADTVTTLTWNGVNWS
jgi:hypothetical protein